MPDGHGNGAARRRHQRGVGRDRVVRQLVEGRIDGQFDRGDAVVLRGPDGAEVGRGLVAYDSNHAARIMGHSTSEIEALLGVKGRSEMVHRDDLALGVE